MAPILSFTAEEIWQYMPDKERRPRSVFLSPMPEPDANFLDQRSADKWDRVFRERVEVLKALEAARSAKIIGHSLDAEVVFSKRNTKQEPALLALLTADRAQDVLIVSQLRSGLLFDAQREENDVFEIVPEGSLRPIWTYYSESLDTKIAISKARGEKCERCWKYDTEVGRDADHPTVCPRCAAVLKSGVSA
jgi:isoleucyl-tRNA synthetase